VRVRLAINIAYFCISLGAFGAEPPDVDDPDELLARVRNKVAEHLAQLPNYTCHEVIERFGRPFSLSRLDHLDTVEVEVAFVGNRELFARPAATKFEDQSITKIISNGTIGNGAFGAHAEAIFTGDAASFRYAGPSNKEGHKTFRYDFTVPRDKSRFLVRHSSASGIVGYTGSFWVDAETLDLVRLELKAEHIPASLGVSRIEDTMRYKRVKIGNGDFLLPYKSELAAVEQSGYYYLNMVSLEHCQEFTGESLVTFGAPTGDDSSADRDIPHN
jgi:hypothetical protein